MAEGALGLVSQFRYFGVGRKPLIGGERIGCDAAGIFAVWHCRSLPQQGINAMKRSAPQRLRLFCNSILLVPSPRAKSRKVLPTEEKTIRLNCRRMWNLCWRHCYSFETGDVLLFLRLDKTHWVDALENLRETNSNFFSANSGEQESSLQWDWWAKIVHVDFVWYGWWFGRDDGDGGGASYVFAFLRYSIRDNKSCRNLPRTECDWIELCVWMDFACSFKCMYLSNGHSLQLALIFPFFLTFSLTAYPHVPGRWLLLVFVRACWRTRDAKLLLFYG